MKKYINIAIMAAAALTMAACTEGDKFEAGREVLLISGTASSPVVSFAVEGETGSYPLSVSATGKVSQDVKATVKVDPSLVEAYNASHKSNYFAVPAEAVSLDEDVVVIRKGEASSSVNNVNLLNSDFFVDGRLYMIPVTITSSEGMDVLEASRTIYLRISRVIRPYTLDISDSNLSSNFIFTDEQAIPLSQYTYEIKVYPTNLKNKAGDICRLCAWEGANEEKANMLRFNENGYAHRTLQLVSPAGNIVSNTTFEENNWYMLSLVYDGASMKMYVNGVPEEKVGTGDGTTTFQRFELGMSWGGGYPASQLFNGRIAEVRVWDRAISVNEMKLGFCGVDTSSEGLRAYWKFNEGEGYIFHDATGNGYDMDWSKTKRDSRENGVLVDFDKSEVASRRWVLDDINKCSN